MFFVFYIIPIIFIIISIFISLTQNQKLTVYPLLDIFLKKEQFSNISENPYSNLVFVNASNRGQNFLFSFKSNSYMYSLLDIDTIYEKAQKDHIRNIILLTRISLPENISNKLKEYNIQVCDYNKLISLAYSSEPNSILQTSNTSDDTCKIEANQFDPIQKPKSFLENLFSKPDQL